MNWKLFKTNWFTIALVLIMLLSITRKFLPFGSGGNALPKKEKQKDSNPEKYTATDNQSLLDLSSSSRPQAAPEPVVDKPAAVAFIRRFENVAVSERKKFGIPSSILLACAYVNSTAGKADWVNRTNNFFALPCEPDWEGETATINGKCLRRYESAWASFRDFSIFLTSRDWYGSVKKSAGKDWQKWAQELAKHDLSGQSGYAEELERVIQAHRLYDLDEM